MTDDRLHLIVHLGTDRVAFPADAIEAVVPVWEVTPVPGAEAEVIGLVPIRSRVLTLLDARRMVGQNSAAPPPYMALTSHDGHGYALALDRAEDVRALKPPRKVIGNLSPAWRALEPSLGEVDGESILVVDPGAFVALANAGTAAAA